MTTPIREVMTDRPVALTSQHSLKDAAKAMRDHDIGAVVVMDGDHVAGVITDRDIVVRGLAENRRSDDTPISDCATANPTMLGPDDPTDRAVQLMAEEAVRRIPVVDNGKLVGMVSLGDLAERRDPDSVLGEISSEPPNN